jgi:hypothetical protein
MQLIRIESEQIISMARAEPVDYAAVREEMIAVIEAFPTFAKEVMYMKPVGKDADGHQNYARGLSIRAAEELRRIVGFNRVAATEETIDEFHVQVTATFVDYAKGNLWQDSGVVSKRYKTRQGATVVMSDDRFHNLFVKAEKSRRIREVVLRSMPAGLKMELVEAVDRQLDELLDEGTVNKIVANFASKGVSKAQLEVHLGKKFERWVKEDRKVLVGVWNLIKQGETPVEDVFPPLEKPKEAEPGDPSEPKKTRGEEVAEKLRGKNNDHIPEDLPQCNLTVGSRAPVPEPETSAEPGAEKSPIPTGVPKQTKAVLLEAVDAKILECARARVDLTSIPIRLGILDLNRSRLEGLKVADLKQAIHLLNEKLRGDDDGTPAEEDDRPETTDAPGDPGGEA